MLFTSRLYTATRTIHPLARRVALAAAVGAPAVCVGRACCESAALKSENSKKDSCKLALWQRAANVVYNSPFKSIIGFIVPAYLGIFMVESANPRTANMPLSQRLIHTRVYGQGIAVLTTVSIMSFVSVMEKQGGIYRVENGEIVRGQQMWGLRHWYSRPDDELKAEEKAIAEQYEAHHGPSNDLLLPLIYAPLLPFVWVGLRGRIPTDQLTKIIMGITGVAFVHAGYIMVGDSSMVMG
ncbi:MAG: hypothetical protein SGPRY_000371 [Prymnesium sp.]